MSLLLHVGYPKAASTWLQDHVFSSAHYGFGEPGPHVRGRAIAEFVVCNAFRFDGRAARGAFEPDLCAVRSGGHVPVISDETLCGDPFQRRYDGRAVAERLHATFPEARVLLCVREQRAMAVSMYRQYLLQGGLHGLREFIGTGDEPPGMTSILRADFLEFDLIAGFYRELFGPDRVLVMPVEALGASGEGVKRIQAFCGLEPSAPGQHERSNVGYSAAALLFRRSLGAFSQRGPLSQNRTLAYRAVIRGTRLVDGLAPRAISRRVEEGWRNAIATRYAGTFGPSNQRLAAAFDLPLERYGYDCGEGAAGGGSRSSTIPVRSR